MRNTLDLFNPLVARWFKERYTTATDIQSRAWQAISRNRHVLMSAPTGSGKTMAAFLWSLNQVLALLAPAW
jgi:ATP-dependent Lhr-like helicase